MAGSAYAVNAPGPIVDPRPSKPPPQISPLLPQQKPPPAFVPIQDVPGHEPRYPNDPRDPRFPPSHGYKDPHIGIDPPVAPIEPAGGVISHDVPVSVDPYPAPADHKFKTKKGRGVSVPGGPPIEDPYFPPPPTE